MTHHLNLSYHSQLDNLFCEWKAESLKYDEPRENYPNGKIIFTEDGLIEKSEEFKIDIEKEWRKSDKRIMFLLKDQPSDWCDDARLWLKKSPENCQLKSRFLRNIANIFWGLYYADREHLCTSAEMQKSFEEIKACFNTKPFAFVECKKQGGATSISNSTLKKYISRYKDFLIKEMDILQPNIIVCTSSVIYEFVCNNYFKTEDLIKIDEIHNSIRLHNKRGTLIFCSYHPSARKSREIIYEGVMEHYRAFLKSKYLKNI